MSINGYALQAEAKRILQEKEGDIAASRPVVPHADRVRFEELAEDFLNDYRVNGKRSLDRAERSVKRLKGCFAEWKASNITTPAVRVYITKRQEAKAGNETINRELAALKRMFSLALQAERLLRQPCTLHLAEDNVRTGFYGEAEVLALYEALLTYLKPVALFALFFGWRLKSGSSAWRGTGWTSRPGPCGWTLVLLRTAKGTWWSRHLT